MWYLVKNIEYESEGKKRLNVQWNLELRTQSVPGDGSTFKLFDFRVKFPHKK
jgi:hypothetical protein